MYTLRVCIFSSGMNGNPRVGTLFNHVPFQALGGLERWRGFWASSEGELSKVFFDKVVERLSRLNLDVAFPMSRIPIADSPMFEIVAEEFRCFPSGS